MSTYHWDFGFDFNAVQTPNNNDDQLFLQHGFVANQSPEVPATPVNLNVDDVIGFNVFNVTDSSTGTYSITGGSIQFQNAVTGQAATSPFSVSMLSIPSQATSSGSDSSVIFSGIQSFQAQPDPLVTFPTYDGPSSQTVINNGRFLMTVTLTVTGPDTTTKIFVVDPEMVVGGAG